MFIIKMEDDLGVIYSEDDKILVGSAYFFRDYEDFIVHDYDYIVLVDQKINGWRDYLHLYSSEKKLDLNFYCKHDKEWFIKDQLNYETPNMFMQKFLVREFANAIGFTIEDLDSFKFIVNALDYKHEYIKVIYDAYIKNGDFTLTQEQLDAAYEEYKKERPHLYKIDDV